MLFVLPVTFSTSFMSTSFRNNTLFLNQQGRNIDARFPRTKIFACAAPKKKRTRKPNGYWRDINNIRAELLLLQPNSNEDSLKTIPTAKQLRELRRGDIDNAITTMGGYHKVAEMLGCKTSSRKKPRSYWSDFSNLEKEMAVILKNAKDQIQPGMMPTLKQLRSMRRADIVEAIEQHGGSTAVSDKLGLKMRVQKKSKHYWKDWSKVELDLRIFVAQRIKGERKNARKENARLSRSRALRMPSQQELRVAGRGDLAEAISDFHGGFRQAATKLGFVPSKKDDFFYDDFYNLARELYAFQKEIGLECVMPTTNVLKKEGRTDIAAAIVKYGGMALVAQRLGLQYRIRASEAFKNWNLFRRSLMAFMETHGTPGQIPSSRILNNFGRSDLYQAILHHGGTKEVADRMGLKRNYWQDFNHVGLQVLEFIVLHGTEGVMPTESEFIEVGRTALNLAVSKFGYSQVAKRLGLREPMQSTRLAFDSLLNAPLDCSEDCSDEDGDELRNLGNAAL